MSSDNPHSRDNMGQPSGVAPPESPASAPPKNNNCAMIALGIAVVGTLLILCCGVLSYIGVTAGVAALKAPVDHSISVMSADDEVAEKLGLPIESTSTMGVNDYQNDNGNGGSKVDFRAKGSQGSANVTGNLTLTNGDWSVDKLNIEFSDGTTVTLPRGTPE